MEKTENFDLQRKVVSHMVSESWKNIPHVSYLYEPDVTDFYNRFKVLARKKAKNGRKLTFNSMILKTIVEGIKAAPNLNSLIAYSHHNGEGALHVSDEINISVPWLLPDGRMITPVLLHTESMSLDVLSDEITALGKKIENTNIDELLYSAAVQDTVKELKKFNLRIFRRIFAAKISFHPVKGLSGKEKKVYYEQPKKNRLTAENLVSATVTVSNIGSLYKEQTGCFGLLEIIPPQVFSIGVGAIQEKPGVYIREDGCKEIGIRYFLPMCLAFDHRAVDFSALVPFLKELDRIFSNASEIYNW